MTSARPIFWLLRAALVLLMLGIVIKPVLGLMCEIHALSDALADIVVDVTDVAGDEHHQTDRDHASGAHKSLHEDNQSGAYADLVKIFVIPVGPFGAVKIPPPTDVPVARQHVAGPFRPPIA